MTTDIEAWFLSHRLFATLVVMFLLWAFREGLVRLVRSKRVILREKDRKRINFVRNITSALMIALVVIIWLPQIQRFALSITAVAVAVVVATKELLSCITGSFLRGLASSFVIGDWIRVGETFGEVIEESPLTTTVMEINPATYELTGRTTTIPNSIFLSATVVNQNFLKRFVFQDFSLVTSPEGFPFDRRADLLLRIELICADFSELAARYNTMLERRTGIDIRNAEIDIRFHTSDIGMVITTINIFCPTDRLRAIEQQITDAFFAWRHEQAGPTPA